MRISREGECCIQTNEWSCSSLSFCRKWGAWIEEYWDGGCHGRAFGRTGFSASEKLHKPFVDTLYLSHGLLCFWFAVSTIEGRNRIQA